MIMEYGVIDPGKIFEEGDAKIVMFDPGGPGLTNILIIFMTMLFLILTTLMNNDHRMLGGNQSYCLTDIGKMMMEKMFMQEELPIWIFYRMFVYCTIMFPRISTWGKMGDGVEKAYKIEVIQKYIIISNL